nr:uncharacterized protein LOC114821441 [Malus domestica]
MAKEDLHKTAFRCPGYVRAYEYLVRSFELKNVSATYQIAMKTIFHDLIGHSMEVYIDDIMLKSKTEEQHLIDLRQVLTRMRIHKLKMNPKKSAFGKSIGSLLAQNNEGGKEQAIYYLSRILTEVETRYTPVEKLCLALYVIAYNLRNYMLPCHIHIIAKTDMIKYILSKPMLTGRIGKWILVLSEFSFQYVPQRAIKGQAIADFLVEHQEAEDEIINIPGTLEVANLWIPPSKALSSKEEWAQRKETTNNRAEYEALIIVLEILIELGATEVEVFGDSELVINQLNGEYKCRHITITGYYLAATQLLSYWGTEISVSYIPRESYAIANEMAQLASGAHVQARKFEGDIEVQKRNPHSIFERGFSLDIMTDEMEMKDWRTPIV